MKLLRVVFYFCLLWGVAAHGQVYVIPVQGTIDMGLAHFISREVEGLNKKGGKAIILDVDTFGGRVDAATEIRDALLKSDLLTIAFINARAISAGALISLACDTIIMVKGATLGATTVVDIKMNKASEKAQSYMREEMAATAEAKGRNGRIAMAMVDESLDIDTLVVAPGDTLFLTDVEGAQPGKLLTLRTRTALKYHMADYEMNSLSEILKHYGWHHGEVVMLKPTWSEQIVRFLTNPIVSSLLMTLGFLGLLFELQSPGWGVPGSLGLLALVLFFSTSIIADLASITDLLIMLVGVAMLVIELLAIPGFGVVGIGGIFVMLYGLFRMLVPETPTPKEINMALLGLTISIAGGIVGVVVLARGMASSRVWRRISLAEQENREDGYSMDLGLEELVGQEGVTITKLRPAGIARIGKRRIDVVTLGEWVNPGTRIKVIEVNGPRVIVEPVDITQQTGV